ncbi:S49 family peptidase [Yersinia ruckeri]|uniref:S49 family peptidase n=1 Tax=Yersinia ruckeri TaxID=29486 RepID=UPI0011A1E065|nr:S49 family peptidase [Yersinia ruckeri]EKN4700364.1 S49 family peptidase [Yersinia ruckeri]ELM3740233.1 S49 family peptidase [Yersinia ruckeri]
MMPKLINYPHLASQVFGVPHYATRQTLDSVKAVLIPRLTGAFSAGDVMALEADTTPTSQADVAGGRVAVIPVHGLLAARRGHITNMCTELTSYELIRAQLHKALADEKISEIVLDINSGGGFAVGCKELADYIFSMRDVKPITAIVNFSAYSAAYFIASACNKIVLSQTSGVGSIGVILEHMEASKWEEQVGLKFTTFYRGDYKNTGSPHEPLSSPASAEIQQMIDDAYTLFFTSVAQYRGLTEQTVIDTQARCFTGQAAIDAGLADELSDPQNAINAIAAQYTAVPTSSIQVRATAMRQQNTL